MSILHVQGKNIKSYDVGVGINCGTVCFFQQIRHCHVIGVHKIQIFSGCQFDAFVSGSSGSKMISEYNLNSGIKSRVQIKDFDRTIRRAIVHAQYFEIGHCLIKKTVQTFGQILFYIKYRDDNRHFWIGNRCAVILVHEPMCLPSFVIISIETNIVIKYPKLVYIIRAKTIIDSVACFLRIYGSDGMDDAAAETETEALFAKVEQIILYQEVGQLQICFDKAQRRLCLAAFDVGGLVYAIHIQFFGGICNASGRGYCRIAEEKIFAVGHVGEAKAILLYQFAAVSSVYRAGRADLEDFVRTGLYREYIRILGEQIGTQHMIDRYALTGNGIEFVAVKEYDVCILFTVNAADGFQRVGKNIIIGINEQDICTCCEPETVVPGHAGAAVFLLNDAHSGILGCIILQKIPGIIHRAVIDTNYFKICHGLVQNAVQTLCQSFGSIVYRDNY